MKNNSLYNELFRPQFHFTPRMNWMNDPNGLVYYEGEFHLFYQHNPFGNDWGHMSWGHAVSRDLIHWEHLPVAICEAGDEMIFSGSIVVDLHNTSGFGIKENPPMVAIYTAGRISNNNQSQCIAYSLDKGITWKKYIQNPVLDIGSNNFRDPKVFWFEKENKWIMVAALSVEQKVRFYSSHNLIDWQQAGEFKSNDEGNESWECPDIFQLPVDGNKNNLKWVFTIGKWRKGIPGGSHVDYLIGDFNGNEFIPDKYCENKKEKFLRVDFGRDFYAAHTWANIPASDGRKIMLGWLSNWDYADYLPTSPWRNMQSVPREIKLKTVDGKFRLIQKPIRELKVLRSDLFETKNRTVDEINKKIGENNFSGNQLEILCEFFVDDDSVCGLKIRKGKYEETLIKYDGVQSSISVDRTKSGEDKFSKLFTYISPAFLRKSQKLFLHIFIDLSSIELFVNDGEVVLSHLIFPSIDSELIEFLANDRSAIINVLQVWKLKSIWIS